MRKVEGLTVLETEKEIEQFLKCQHIFVRKQVEEWINPRGEFVVGYGFTPVFVLKPGSEEVCTKCGYVKGSLKKGGKQ